MAHYDHLIVGGGMTAAAAAEAIRKLRPNDSIGVVGSDSHHAYNRPPLSKGLWKGDAEDGVFRKVDELGVALHLGKRATSLDPALKQVTDDAGGVHTYGKLLLATGGNPRQLKDAAGGVIYFRTLDDYRTLRRAATAGSSAAIIGGGFIGSEVAAALAMNGVKVTMLFPEDGIGARNYPAGLSEFIGRYYHDKGVEVLSKESLSRVEKQGTKFTLRTESGKSVEADVVVAGIGITPNVELAEAAGLEVGNGIVVDQYLQTSTADIYAAGDVANFYSPALGNRMRVEHEDNANSMGAAAGRNMAGEPTPYDHLPMFYSDLFDLGYEAVGELDARHDIVEDWKKPFEEGVVYYLHGGRVRGVLLWNTWDQVDNARELIASPGPWT
ncbi:MAG: NAD(P)/FAD-dependent oxidoreductase, partial [Tepidiformaceae bacterium]